MSQPTDPQTGFKPSRNLGTTKKVVNGPNGPTVVDTRAPELKVPSPAKVGTPSPSK